MENKEKIGVYMGEIKFRGRKKRLVKKSNIRSAPRWADIKKFGLKRAMTRRIMVMSDKHWRRSKKKE